MMKKISFKTSIAAPKQKVWDTMLQPDTYQEWVSASWPDSSYTGCWQQGEKVRFVSKDGSGTMALIKEFKPFDTIFAEHVAVLKSGGVEDTQSDEAKGWIGTTEQYHFTEVDGNTELNVEMATNPEWEKMFNDGWPAALKKLKEVCER
jgi:uncharacterized protein YndB with AHSA1/START domain